ncbi:uncharacterized protein LOC115629763 [Scaptodrosophila lebanonensis]|uniref:Uncharacterized protein LOC115629763 n=1 Tax=Drosophila lebanonensis TaxID=7225 RepID=A0A6J2U1E5_DROLE|nr:uncharacterized protein LOC115629763 [Scaptodrosophila lebanonensis]
MSEVSLLDLDDYSLLRVIKYLSDESLFTLTHICSRLRQMVRKSPIKYKYINTFQKSTLECLVSIGSCRELYVYGNSSDSVLDMLINNIGHMTKLEKLELGCCVSKKCSESVCDSIIYAARHLPDLRVLIIRENGNTQNIRFLTHLEALTLHTPIFDKDLIECCKSNKNLKKLDINYYFYKDGQFDGIEEHCQNVEHLVISLGEQWNRTPLASLPKLNYLLIHNGLPRETFNFLSSISAETLGQMEFLQICTECAVKLQSAQIIARMKALKQLNCRFDDVGSLELMAQLTELRRFYLNLRGVMENATRTHLYKIIEANPQLECVFIPEFMFLDKCFILGVIKILRSVRDLSVQKPLIFFIDFDQFSDEIKLIESNYIELISSDDDCYYETFWFNIDCDL